jgi:hypothetical protein
MHAGTYQVVLVGDLLGAFTFVAGIVLAALVFEVARRRPRPTEVPADSAAGAPSGRVCSRTG